MFPAIVLVLAATLGAGVREAHAEWANQAMVAHQLSPDDKPVAVGHADLFFTGTKRGANDFVAAGGTYLETAGSGSTWVYDPQHKIIAFSERGDLTGDQIFYASSPPPFAIVHRDLSHVASAHGLHLGISLADAARILGVSPNVAKVVGPSRKSLFVRQTLEVLQRDAVRVRDNEIVFDHDRATWIELDDVCC